jgi:hypothetical protein
MAANYETPDTAHGDTCEHAKAPESQVPRDFASVFPNLENTPQDWRKFKPTELTVAPIPNAPLTFRMTEYKEENGRTTWTGRNEDMPLASFVFSANAGAWAGVMLLPDGSEFAMHGLLDGSVAVRRATASSLPCPVGEADGHPVHAASASIAADVVVSTSALAAAGQPIEPELDEPDQNGFYHVNLLVVVDKPFVDALGLPVTATQAQIEEQVDATCAAYTASMNTILQNSHVDNLRWFLVGTLIAPDDFNHEEVASSLEEMEFYGEVDQYGNPVSPETMGGPARREASRIGADQILFIAGRYNMFDSASGIAVSPHTWVTNSLTGERSYEYRLKPYAAAYDVGGIKTFAHELGHTFGLSHNREQQEYDEKLTAGTLDNDGRYHYGYMWYLPDLNNSSTLVSCGDVMSYAGVRIAYYSNSQIEINNNDISPSYYRFPDGISRIGVLSSEAKAADATRWLRETAQLMASFRRPLDFLYHPEASVSLASGATLTLSALATVGRTDLGNQDKISYQWYFNNAPITGVASGTLPVLTMTNASAANVGTYNLVATSLGGVSVWSTPAAVTVTSQMPGITIHPGSVSVAKGGTLTLSAVGNGANLTFQWKHNGVAIAGANGSSYTKTSVTEADAGTYTLTVDNGSGPITSQPATVTVTGGSNGGGNSSGSSGGGGGGAPSHWFFAALLVSIIIRKHWPVLHNP